jgi:hypothetical protein
VSRLSPRAQTTIDHSYQTEEHASKKSSTHETIFDLFDVSIPSTLVVINEKNMNDRSSGRDHTLLSAKRNQGLAQRLRLIAFGMHAGERQPGRHARLRAQRRRHWQEQPDFREPPLSIKDAADDWNHRAAADYYSQPRALFPLLTPAQQQMLFENTARLVGGAPREIQLHHIGNFTKPGPAHGKGWPMHWASTSRDPVAPHRQLHQAWSGAWQGVADALGIHITAVTGQGAPDGTTDHT